MKFQALIRVEINKLKEVKWSGLTTDIYLQRRHHGE